ncbi:hypothetical protein V1277_005572 [Bradyrhizobium sp. AZCC 1588]|uniref:hypothetical protein n=1 Tax=unclassified Bradyrhizobium TaxID=2631580 RepID=UPI002FEEEE38
MSQVVCIHGIAQQLKSRESLLAEWAPSLCGGVSNAGGNLDPADVDMAFYGILFRVPGSKDAAQIPAYKPGDLDDPLEIALAEEMYAVIRSQSEPGSDEPTKAGERTVAHLLQAIAKTPFFGNVSQRVVIWFLKQVRRYVTEPKIRQDAQQSLIERIGADTRVVVSHSLGTVVAYETLCARPDLPVRTLITLGSPLGIPALLPRLAPPVGPGTAQWPDGLKNWVNIADQADLVALRKELRPVYGDRLLDQIVHNGATMHNVLPYLTAKQTGRAILEGLAGK